jgi:hypothetical protein
MFGGLYPIRLSDLDPKFAPYLQVLLKCLFKVIAV